MAYYDSLKNILSNNPNITELYSSVNSTSFIGKIFDSKTYTFNIGDYIIISYIDMNNTTDPTFSYPGQISGCNELSRSLIGYCRVSNYSSHGFLYIGQIVENNITISAVVNAAYVNIFKIYRISNN